MPTLLPIRIIGVLESEDGAGQLIAAVLIGAIDRGRDAAPVRWVVRKRCIKIVDVGARNIGLLRCVLDWSQNDRL